MYTWEQFSDEAISMRAAMWVNINDVGRFFNQSALAFVQRSTNCVYRHNHWSWEPVPEVKKDKKTDEVAL